MRMTFRPLTDQVSGGEAVGELHVRPAKLPSTATRFALTLAALEKGPEAFASGAGSISCLVLHTDPTLDDMLAAEVLAGRLKGESFPADVPLAHYAHAVAEGMHPAEGVPPYEIIEGLFKYYRLRAGDPLTDAERAEKLLASWEKLVRVLKPALLDPKIDPFRQSLVAGRPEFHSECLYLKNDRVVYERDVSNGARYRMRLPGEKREIAALRLNEPRSALFKYWARTDAAAPGESGSKKGYQFLAVLWGKGDWFFSTDPLDRLNISSLARALQNEESAKKRDNPDKEAAGTDIWYDGKRHNHSVVRPPHAGTALTEAEVWKVVQGWGRLRRPEPVISRRGFAAVAASAVAIPGLTYLTSQVVYQPPAPIAAGTGKGNDPPTPGPEPTQVALKAKDPCEVFARSDAALPPPRALRSLTFSKNDQAKDTIDLPLDDMRPGKSVTLWLESCDKETVNDIKVNLRDGEGQFGTAQITKWKGKEYRWQSEPVRFIARPKQSVSLTVANPDGNPGTREVNLTVRYKLSENDLALHVLTIGVGSYRNEHTKNVVDGPPDLQFAVNDAKEYEEVFKGMKGTALFADAHVQALKDPTRDQIIDELHEFASRVQKDQSSLKLAVVTFSGHGIIFNEKYFRFLPTNYIKNRPSTCVSWSDIRELIGSLNCVTLVILDCCHSGGAALEEGVLPSRDFKDNNAVGDMIKNFSTVKPGLFILAAADRNGVAYEDEANRHGFVTAAVLDVLLGKCPMPEKQGGVVTLMDLYNYVSTTVPDRVRDKNPNLEQVIIPHFPSGRPPEKIPIVFHPMPLAPKSGKQ